MGAVESEYSETESRLSWQCSLLLGGIALVGLTCIVYGGWLAVRPDEPIVEIVEPSPSSGTRNTLFVDVGGAVEKPGVYSLPVGSRIGDALVAAGGLSLSADRDYVGKTLNLAEIVKDGGKIYIPRQSDAQKSLPAQAGQKTGESVQSRSQGSLININTASQNELESLWGIGEARAQTIISSRPYRSPDELVEKAKIPQSVYDKIKDQISVY